MTVADLIEELKTLPQDLPVILQSDSEGNGYSPLSGVDGSSFYVKENSWSGSVYSEEDLDDDYIGDDVEPEKCCVLYPIN